VRLWVRPGSSELQEGELGFSRGVGGAPKRRKRGTCPRALTSSPGNPIPRSADAHASHPCQGEEMALLGAPSTVSELNRVTAY